MERIDLIINNINLVETLAKISRMRIRYDELVSIGYVALIEAANKYDENGSSFRTFASKRIIGAMKNCGRQFNRWGKWMSPELKMISLDEYINKNNYSDSSLMYYDKDIKFDEIIQSLSQTQKQILRWHFVDELNYKQISAKLELSESRIAQIIQECKEKLRLQFS